MSDACVDCMETECDCVNPQPIATELLIRKSVHDAEITRLRALLKSCDEVLAACNKVFGIVKTVGRETFCYSDFQPEDTKARALREKLKVELETAG